MAAFAPSLLLALLSCSCFVSATPRCGAADCISSVSAAKCARKSSSLLQTQKVLGGRARVVEDALSPSPEGHAALTGLAGGRAAGPCDRIAWLHIPKCGTSFGTSLFHCANASLPEGAHIPVEGTVKRSLVPLFLREYPLSTWFRGRFWEKGGNVGEHTEITDSAWRRFNGHFFGMFRRPSARMYSSWRYFGGQEQGVDVARYAQRIVGQATKMVAGQASGLDCSTPGSRCKELRPDVDLALSRLGGFKFIGLTEEWALSVCLFHAMTGSECLPSEFLNVRPTKDSEGARAEDEKRFFDSYHDPYDEALYERASAIFWASVAKHNVTRESCRRTCSRVQHVFAPEGAMLSFDVD